MELARLAAKQKRYIDILHFAEQEVTDPGVKPGLLRILGEYRQALATCWNEGKVTPESLLAIQALERELDMLHNQARLRSNAP